MNVLTPGSGQIKTHTGYDVRPKFTFSPGLNGFVDVFSLESPGGYVELKKLTALATSLRPEEEIILRLEDANGLIVEMRATWDGLSSAGWMLANSDNESLTKYRDYRTGAPIIARDFLVLRVSRDNWIDSSEDRWEISWVLEAYV